MQHLLIRRSLCLALLSLFFAVPSQAQFLKISPIGQRNSQWCWAASMEMVMNYHGHVFAGDPQCILARTYGYYQNLINSSSSALDVTTPCPVWCGGAGTGLSSTHIDNKTILYSKRGGPIKYQYTDMIYSHYGFHSVEDRNTGKMDWTAIKGEIDACRPFMVYLNSAGGAGSDTPFGSLSYDHVVVAKGYFELEEDQYVLVNEPKTKDYCVGCEAAMPISIFNDPPDELFNAEAVATQIHTQNLEFCLPCKEVEKTPNTILKDRIDAGNIGIAALYHEINTVLPVGTIDHTQIITLVTTPGAPDFYVNQLSYWPGFNPPLQMLTLKVNTDYLTFYMMPTAPGGPYKIKRIIGTECTNAIDQVMILGKGDERFQVPLTINSTDEGGIGIMNFTPDDEQFYRVVYENKPYLMLINANPELPFKPGHIYPEKKVIRTMTCENRKLQELLKRMTRTDIKASLKVNK